MKLLVPVIFGWMAICRADGRGDDEEFQSTAVSEYAIGNLKETLTVDHSSYNNPKGPTTLHQGEGLQNPIALPLLGTTQSTPSIYDIQKKFASKKISIPVVATGKRANKYDKDIENEENVGNISKNDKHKEIHIHESEPTVPQDFLTEIDLMKIPKHNLPKWLPGYNNNNMYTNDGSSMYDAKDDIEELDLGRYFNENYHVPPEYKKFKFMFKGYHEGDRAIKKVKEEKDKEERNKELKTNSIQLNKYKDFFSTTIIPPTIITETKFDYETIDLPSKFSYENSDDEKLGYEYNKEQGKKEHAEQCSGCDSEKFVFPYKHNFYQHKHQFSGYYPPRYVYPLQMRPAGRPAPYMLKYRTRPLNYQLKYPYRYRYPQRKPYPLLKYKKPPNLTPYYNSNPFFHYKRPKYFPRTPYPIQPNPSPFNQPEKVQEEKQKVCAPSKIVKEVHIHHHPETKIKTIPVPIKMDEANHDENNDHELITNDGDNENNYDNYNDHNEEEGEEEIDEYDHRELKDVKELLNDALRKNKNELTRQMGNGQQYQVHEDNAEDDNDSGQRPDYENDNINTYHHYEPKRISSPNIRSSLNKNGYNDKVIIEATPIRLIKLNSYNYNYTTPKNNYER